MFPFEYDRPTQQERVIDALHCLIRIGQRFLPEGQTSRVQ